MENGQTTQPTSKRMSWFSLPPNTIAILGSLLTMTIVGNMIFVAYGLFLLNQKKAFNQSNIRLDRYPLFAFTPIMSGGLGLSEGEIGMQMGVRSAFNMLALIAYTFVSSKTNPMKVVKYTMALWPFTYSFIPLLNVMARSRPEKAGVGSPALHIVLFVFFVFWSFGAVTWGMVHIPFSLLSHYSSAFDSCFKPCRQ